MSNTLTDFNQVYNEIDWPFIDRLEKPHVLKGYVPPGDHSGVTVSTGVDLGQRDIADITRLKLPNAFAEKLFSYTLLKGRQAILFLERHPLAISLEESELLSEAVKREILKVLMIQWEKRAGTSFELLPSRLKTVLMSIAYNKGPGFLADYPALIRFIKLADWKSVQKIIFEMKPEMLRARRNEEQAYLSALLIS